MEFSKVRLLDLQVFVTLIKEKNFSKAGKKLDMTQSSVTQVLQKLEDELGSKLITRSSKFFTLTSSGKMFLDAATDILNRYTACKQDIEKNYRDEHEKLKLAVSTTPGEFILPPFFSEFSSNVPNIRLIIEMCDSKKAIDMLLEKDCQIAIVGSIMESLDADYEIVPLIRERLVMIVSKNVETTPAGKISPDQLAIMTRIDREIGSGTQNEAGKYLDDITRAIRDCVPDCVPRTMQLQSVQAILSAVAASDNMYAIVGFYPAKKYMDMGQVKIVDVEGIQNTTSRVISLVHNKREMTDNIAIFRESIEKFFEMQSIFEK